MLKYDTLEAAAQESAPPFCQLILLIGSQEKLTAVLRGFAQRKDVPYINVSLGVSQRLLGLTPQQRTLKVSQHVEDLIDPGADLVVLDRPALLFDRSLQLKPLATLRRLARRRTVVVAWPGHLDGDHLVYAEPDHPEYRRCPAGDALLVLA